MLNYIFPAIGTGCFAYTNISVNIISQIAKTLTFSFTIRNIFPWIACLTYQAQARSKQKSKTFYKILKIKPLTVFPPSLHTNCDYYGITDYSLVLSHIIDHSLRAVKELTKLSHKELCLAPLQKTLN